MDLSKLNVFCKEHLELRKKARVNFKDFVKFIRKSSYDVTWFHEAVMGDLSGFLSGTIDNMMLFAPPQHGKSELSSRLAPAFLLGQDPSLKLAIVCYASTIAQGFSRDVQNIIGSQAYGELFPETKIDGIRGIKKGTLTRNNYEFHTDAEGYVISVGIGGALTSKTVDIAIIDDLYKDKSDAWSPIWRQKVWDWYFSVLERRLHSKSKILILYTRWHEFDLAGKLLELEPERWEQIKYEIVKTANCENPKDIRAIGEALWPSQHSLEDAIRWQELDPISFESLGQQNPKPKKGKMYPKHKIYTELPSFEDMHYLVKSYTDTADDGSDYLASAVYIECDGYCYIIDMVYTQDSMEYTEPQVAEMFNRNNCLNNLVESNNGGKGFAREVERLMNNKNAYVDWFHQSDNKESRIYANAAKVMNRIIFPADWKDRWPEAHLHFVGHMREGKPEYDDFADMLTGIAEHIETIVDDYAGVYFSNKSV